MILGTLVEGGEEAPWVTAGIAASLLMVAAVVVREVVLRNARQRYLSAQRRLDRNVKRVGQSRSSYKKISIRDNDLMLGHIMMKSGAAKTLSELPDGHREVMGLCDDYLELTKKELARTDINSPRYVAMKKGRQKIHGLHRQHTLAWSELRSRVFLRKAENAEGALSRASNAGQALGVVEQALLRYPDEQKLLDSAAVLREFVAAARTAQKIEEAEGLESLEDYPGALSLYEDILEGLEAAPISKDERQMLREKIDSRLQKLRLR